eukprot:3709473-Rhodomonas_salina.1
MRERVSMTSDRHSSQSRREVKQRVLIAAQISSSNTRKGCPGPDWSEIVFVAFDFGWGGMAVAVATHVRTDPS